MTAGKPANPGADRLSGRPVVLLVDDEPEVLASLKRLLRSEPYELLATDRPEEALAWVQRGDVSLVISDQRMAGVTGTQLLDEVARCSPDTARVILTGYPGSTVVVSGMSHGIHKLLYKPWDDSMLKETVRELLRKREGRGAPGKGNGGSVPAPEGTIQEDLKIDREMKDR